MRPPQDWRRARVTLAIAAVTAVAWLLISLFAAEQWAMIYGGFIPGHVTEGVSAGAPWWATPLTMTLVHAGLFHLGFNLLMLLFCGRPVENVLGPPNLLILYVAGAYAAALAEYALAPESVGIVVGASGAISSVLGAYAILFGRNKVKVADPRLALWLHALWLLAAWTVLQLIVGYAFGGGQIAIAAHIGGFIAGVVLANPLLLWRYRGA